MEPAEYTIVQLLDMLGSIDRQKHPERTKALEDELEKKRRAVARLRKALRDVEGAERRTAPVGYLDFLLAALCGVGGLALVLGLLGTAGLGTVTWNGQQVHGLEALGTSVFVALVLSLFSGTLVYVGHRIVRALRHESSAQPSDGTGAATPSEGDASDSE